MLGFTRTSRLGTKTDSLYLFFCKDDNALARPLWCDAPVGSVIIYRPVEMQEYKGKTVYGHIEIKTDAGYVSDYFTEDPTYRTNPVTLVSPVGHKIPVSYKVIGIWFKE